MSYIKTRLPEVNELEEMFKKDPNSVKRYTKYDILQGSEESIRFIEKLLG